MDDDAGRLVDYEIRARRGLLTPEELAAGPPRRRQAPRHGVVGTFTGHILRWGVPRLSNTDDMRGRPRWTMTERGALDDWLSGGPALPLVAMHGRPADEDDPHPLLDRPCGEWAQLRRTDTGLWGRAEVWGTPLGHQVFDAVLDGRLTGLSFRGTSLELVESRATRDGSPVLEIRGMVLAEAGPVDNPADPGALVETVDDVPCDLRGASTVEEALSAVGVDLQRGVDRLRDADAARRERVAERVRTIEGLAVAVKRATRRATALRSEWFGYGTRRRPAGLTDEWRDAREHVRHLAARLAEEANYDLELIEQALNVFGVRVSDVRDAQRI